MKGEIPKKTISTMLGQASPDIQGTVNTEVATTEGGENTHLGVEASAISSLCNAAHATALAMLSKTVPNVSANLAAIEVMIGGIRFALSTND